MNYFSEKEDLVEPSKDDCANSLMVTNPLVSILTGNSSPLNAHDLKYAKAKLTVQHSNQEQTKDCFDNIHQQLTAALKECVLTLLGRREYLLGYQQYLFKSMGKLLNEVLPEHLL